MNKHRVFPRVLTRLIEVGESTGELANVMQQGATQMAQHRKGRNAIVSTLAYPACVVTAATSVSVYLVLVVIPKLQSFLTAMGRPLPSMTQSLLTFSQTMQSWAPMIAMVFLGLCGGVYATYRHPRGRLILDRCMLSIPFLGPIFRLSGTITFSSTLGTMLRSGVTLLDALSAIETLHRNRYLASTVAIIRQAVVRGQSLTAALKQTTAYMPMLAQMVAIAEQTGKTTEILEHVTKFHEDLLQATTKRLASLLEPLLIVFIGGFVGYVYIAFFVALMSAGGSGR
jgi:type IV pilus assembly protein PilC